MEMIVENSQVPIFVGILFFIFHMPIINHLLFRHLAFLSLNNEDGSFNVYGLLFKSILFGTVYFLFTQIVHFLGDL